MTDAAAIAAQLVDVRNVGQHKCVKLTLHVPAEQAGQVMEAFGWPTMVDPVPVAVARLVQPAAKEVVQTTNSPSLAQPASTSPPGRASYRKLSQLAGILSKTPLFHRYLETLPKFHTVRVGEDTAAEFIRRECNVRSRSEIIAGTHPGDNFIILYDDFIRWRDADQYVEAS